ncbi:50S ribosomal protein L25/general stress protein Ctc [Jiangella rhizosphaerae]|uniref:Large ribosomal subunit protein bL25 n=1 Tax=Jiangella rhizosphaerae TaxID=2293569 RepID=A0A418KNF7_9ACTN|nr:50S ribosomal protein L25/general stress protein Ctc [Jiangella rhizosphaerae]RIQ20472.1 50S ribosomal protein L25/general stress protein Ctc [Jiangella rhizosphaerae]
MSDVKIAAELRTEFGKGAARRLRRAAKVPAVLYGHGTDPVHLALPGHDTMLALKTPNVLITLDIEGRGSELALPKHVQRDPLKGFIEHVDLLLVKRGEKVTVEVAVHVTGEAAPGTLVNLESPTVSIEAEATHLPEGIEVSVEGLEEGTQIHAKDLTLARGSSLAGDPEQLVVNVTAAPTAEQLEGEVEEAATEEEAPAGEAAAEEAPAAEASSDES